MTEDATADRRLKTEMETVRRSLKNIERLVLARADDDRRLARKYREWCKGTVESTPRLERIASTDDSYARAEYHLRGLQSIFRDISDVHTHQRMDPIYHWCRHIESKLKVLGNIKGEEMFPDPKDKKSKGKAKR